MEKLTFLILLLLSGCSDHIKIDRHPLVADFEAYQSVEEFERLHSDFELVSPQGNDIMKVYNKDAYILNDSKGRMHIRFFRDLLYAVVFVPDDCTQDLSLLIGNEMDKRVIKLSEENSEGVCFVAWYSKKLKDKFNYFVK